MLRFVKQLNPEIRTKSGLMLGLGETREELLSNLREALSEAIEMNREAARNAAGEQFEEVALQP